jgi:hypothetical protein
MVLYLYDSNIRVRNSYEHADDKTAMLLWIRKIMFSRHLEVTVHKQNWTRKQNNYNVFNRMNIFRRSSESYGFEHGPGFQGIYSNGEGCKCIFHLQQI